MQNMKPRTLGPTAFEGVSADWELMWIPHPSAYPFTLSLSSLFFLLLHLYIRIIPCLQLYF